MDIVDGDADISSDYGETIGTEWTSIKTATLLHLHEHGRRYQALVKGRYGLPNDSDEQVREWIKHKMFLDYLNAGNLFRSPIGDHPQKIVDLGTGVGYWAADVAQKYPSARIIGNDLSPIQPSLVPPNLEIRVEDIEDPRPWTSIYANSDLIHMRSVLQTLRNPRKVLSRVFENLAPGGWIECQDTIPRVYSSDGTPLDDHPLNRLYQLVDGPFARVYGWQIGISINLPDILKELGFVNVSQHRYPLPLGPWQRKAAMREVAMFHQSITMDFVSAMLARHEIMELTEEDATELGQQIFDSFNDVSRQAVVDWGEVWAQKPS